MEVGPSFSQKWERESYWVGKRSATEDTIEISGPGGRGTREDAVHDPCAAGLTMISIVDSSTTPSQLHLAPHTQRRQWRCQQVVAVVVVVVSVVSRADATHVITRSPIPEKDVAHLGGVAREQVPRKRPIRTQLRPASVDFNQEEGTRCDTILKNPIRTKAIQANRLSGEAPSCSTFPVTIPLIPLPCIQNDRQSAGK